MTLRNRILVLCSWAGLNALGVKAYLFFAANLWLKPGEEDEQGTPGNAFYWLSHSVPMLVLFLVTNISVVSLLRRSQDKQVALTATVAFRVLAVVWMLVILFDKYRSQ